MRQPEIIIRPFANHGYLLPLDERLVRYVMPFIKANSWCIVCFVLAETRGTQAQIRKQIPHSAIQKGTGIKSRTTVRDCLDEITTPPYNILLETQGSYIPGLRGKNKQQRFQNSYELNRNFALTVPPQRDKNGSVNNVDNPVDNQKPP